jgi:hypothetical protein
MKRLLVPALLLNAALLGVRAFQEADSPVEAQASPSEVIIDNGRPGTSFIGVWTKSSAPSPFGTESLYNSAGGNRYVWTGGLGPGEYDVSVWWTSLASRNPQAKYEIHWESQQVNVVRDQRSGGGRWNSLGSVILPSGGFVTVRLLTQGSFSHSADAVRFTRKALELTPREREILNYFTVDWDYVKFDDTADYPLVPFVTVNRANLRLLAGPVDGSGPVTPGTGNLLLGHPDPIDDPDFGVRYDRSGYHNIILGVEVLDDWTGSGGLFRTPPPDPEE